MLFEKDKLQGHLDRYLAFVCREIDVYKAVLYGSYAYGIPHDDSDIDLVILSDDFAQMPKLERHQFSLLGEVREKGIVVYEANSGYEQDKG